MKAYSFDYLTGERTPIKAAAIRLLLDNGREIEIRLTGIRDKNAVEVSVPAGGVLVVRPASPHEVQLKVDPFLFPEEEPELEKVQTPGSKFEVPPPSVVAKPH